MITGASSGIGAGVAKAFAKEGAQVIINYPNDEEEENPEPGFPNGDGTPKGFALRKSKKDDGSFDEIEPEEAKTQILVYDGFSDEEDDKMNLSTTRHSRVTSLTES